MIKHSYFKAGAQAIAIAMVAAGLAVTQAQAAPRAQAAGAGPLTCTTTLPTASTVVNTKANGGPLAPGETRQYTIPGVWTGAVALVAQIATTSTGAAQVEASSTGSDGRTVVKSAKGKAVAAAVIPVSGGTFRLTASTGTVDIVLRVGGYLVGPDCFTAVTPTPVVDTATGSGPVSAGSDVDVPLTPAVVPDKLDEGLVSLELQNTSSATATVDLYDADGLPFGRRFVPARRTVNVTEFVPPTQSGTLRVHVITGAVNVRAIPIGWMAPGIPVTSERVVLTPMGPVDERTPGGLTAEGEGPVPPFPGSASPPVTTFELPTQARDAAAVYIAATIRPAVGQVGSLKVWKTGAREPSRPSVEAVAAGAPTTQLLVVRPGTGGTISARPTAQGMRWSLSVVGWSSKPATVNTADDDVIAVPPDSVTLSPDPDPSTGGSAISYTGTQTLEPGDILAAAPSDANPTGLLVKVSSVDIPSSTGASRASATTSVQTATVQPASLADALPNYDFTYTADVSTDAIEPVPDPAPLPPADPPGGGIAAKPASPGVARSAVLLPTSLDSGDLDPCAGVVAGSVRATATLSGRVVVSAAQNRNGTTPANAQFDFDGTVTGNIVATIPGKASCHDALAPMTARMQPMTFIVGGIPVSLTPTASLALKADFETGEKMNFAQDFEQERAAKLSMQLHYQDGVWTDSTSATHGMAATYDGRLGGDGRVDARVSFDAKFFSGAQGGWHVDTSPYGTFHAASTQTPWWTVDGGVSSGGAVDFAALGLGLNISHSVSLADRAESRIGTAVGGFPGPTAGQGGLPNGKQAVAYDQPLVASGGVAPYRWYLSGGSIPPGLSLRSDGHVVGTPTSLGTWSFSAYPIDAAGNRSAGTRSTAITVDSPPDTDGDGIPDYRDGCPTASGPAENGGCPWPDSDGDGTPDRSDACPSEPGPAGNGGCPFVVTVSWGSRAPSNICGGDTSCTYLTVSWRNFSGGNHAITPYFDGQLWCSGSCTTQFRSGSSGSMSGFWAAGYCRQGHGVSATLDGVGSNTISTVGHGC